ncbi:hypothetical protein WJX73_003735 [Symbiochloris irregularis]|uniref:Uncharacterized protein n=1 Tax=Symbiochloris irregularis TaxID=706552 RepID=A0AAW1PED5_9CHLO
MSRGAHGRQGSRGGYSPVLCASPGSLEASGLVERHKARVREEGRMNSRDAAASRKSQTGHPAGMECGPG